MTSMPASKAREQFADIINRVQHRGERVVLERRGIRVAALAHAQALHLRKALDDRLDVESARAALAEKGPNIPWSRLKAELRI